MVAPVTSLLRSEPKSLNLWARMGSCSSAILTIAKLQHGPIARIRHLTTILRARLVSSKLQLTCLPSPRWVAVECGPNFSSLPTQFVLVDMS